MSSAELGPEGTGAPGVASGRRSTEPDAEEQRALRERVTRLAFGGDRERFEEFVSAIREATPPDVEVILRGSAVTGHKWLSTEPFDADGPHTSDLDVTFVGGNMVSLYNEFHIPHLHSVPLSDEHPSACPALVELRERLSAMAGRPVNLQATTSLVQFMRDVIMNQQYLILVKRPEAEQHPGEPGE